MALRFKSKKPKKWSAAWKSSKNPRKQKKYVFNAPLHIKHKFLAVHLSKDLRTKYGFRTLEVRLGDKVKIMRGSHKGKTAEVESINLRNTKVFLKDMIIKKKDGSSVSIGFNPSNLMLIELKLNDKKRLKHLDEIKKRAEKIKNAKDLKNNEKVDENSPEKK